MEHKTLEQLQRAASIHPEGALGGALSRRDRLERWAELLEAKPQRPLRTLWETEYRPRGGRFDARADDSAVTVAFEDPLLRAQGLTSDSYGAAKQFFRLTDYQMHEIVCSCRHGSAQQAGEAAAVLRQVIGWTSRTSILDRVRTFLRI
jgi:hypothetical protein